MENRLSAKWRNLLSFASFAFCTGALVFNMLTPVPPAPPAPAFMENQWAFMAECHDLKAQSGERQADCVIVETDTPDGVQFALLIE